MEVKVSVDGAPRVVCGVTKETTCQEVVVALAQALSQPGRYMLREKFKDFERSMTPGEHLLETLEKYGELAKEVQLTLILSGPSLGDEMTRSSVGRYQQCPPLRRKDAGARMRRGSSSLALHRQSLPTLPENSTEDVKRPKRKSLTFMEEAREWLDSLGKGKVYSTSCDKENNKKADKKSRNFLKLSLNGEKEIPGIRGRVKGHRGSMSDLEVQTSCCIGGQIRYKEGKHRKPDHLRFSDYYSTEGEKNSLKERVIMQLARLQDLELQIARVDKEISELEKKQKADRAEQEAQERAVTLEMEKIKLWENELKAEEGHEKELQSQFLELKEKVMECKVKLEENKNRIPGGEVLTSQHVEEHSQMVSKVAATVVPETDAKQQQTSDADMAVNVNRKSLPRDTCSSPQALVPPNQTKERRPTGPTELREWWTRWSEAQSPPSQTKKKVHRSELTIYLGSTKV